MTRIRWTSVAVLCATLLVAACGGSSGTSSPDGTSPVVTAPAATGTGTRAPSSADAGGIGIGGAAAKLADLGSYKFAITMAAEGAATFSLVQPGGSMTISGTIILKPAIAMDVTMATTDATGAAAAFGYRILDGRAYVSLGRDMWMETDATDAASTVDSFKPEKFMAGFGGIQDLQPAGDESRNGVSTTHYTGAAPATFGSMFGLPTATWTMDAWVAKDGGYLVASSLVGEATDGKFTMSMDVSDLDSADNKVEAPGSFTPLGG